MRVLFVTQYWPPETGAAPARARHFALALARAGHEVRVVTGLPNHPSGVVRPGWEGRAGTRETAEGVVVERVWLHATPRKTALTRLWNHLTFAWSALPRALGGPRPDVVIATMPPLFLGVTAWLAARRHRAPMVADLRDDWPHAAVALGEMREGVATRLLDALSRFLQARSARVLAVTPGMRDRLAARGLDSGRIELLPNGADTELFRPETGRNGEPPAGPLTVLYAGTHGLVHGMEALMDAAERLRDRADLRFVLVGDGVAKPELERRARERRLDRVAFRASVAPESLVALIHAADVCVATTRAGTFPGETIPVKLFDYLACGRPVVAAVSGDAAAVVEASGGGVVVAPGDGVALADALVALAADPARRAALAAAGPTFVERLYSRRALGERFVAMLERVRFGATGRSLVWRPGGVYGLAKRAGDLVLSALGLAVCALPMLVLAVAIRLDSPGPALFRQRRIGRGSREFTILKFRTMSVGTPDLATHLVGPGSRHVTRLGTILRRTSLDELPQLWNVFTGSMALIGPRPALYNQDDLITLRQEGDVDALRPGVTGWAQVNGRDEIPLDLKVRYDREYLERVSLGFDLVVAWRTVGALFTSRGAI
jgi:lipopolysaccharide/colanic/teichoic acid biosynthesis glycosyltransferase/glycosyltransferase involved in cell wall biosynthesis